MDRDSASWLREAAKFYLMYLAVGAAFAPFGLVYGLLALQGWDHWLVAVFLLGAGFLVGRYVWGRLERRLFVKPVSLVRTITFSAPGVVSGLLRPVGVATILLQMTSPAFSSGPSENSAETAAAMQTISLPV